MTTMSAARRGLVAAGGILLAQSALAADLLVPAVYPTIQRAIDAAQPGDWVVVAPGTYRENLYIEKSVLLRSTTGATATVLDGGGDGPVIVARGTGPEYVAIVGFTITNGNNRFDNPRSVVPGSGGAMFLGSVVAYVANNDIVGNVGCLGPGISTTTASVTIVNNRIRDNIQDASCYGASGGGIFYNGDGPLVSTIAGNEISGHRIGGYGAGIMVNWSTGLHISSNSIVDNATDVGGFGGGIFVGGSATVVDNAITGNSAPAGGGAAALFATDATHRIRFSGNTLKDNTGDYGSAASLYSYYHDGLKFTTNTLEGSSVAPLVYCISTFTFLINRSNRMSNSQGPLVGGFCAEP